jgi:sialate O-acetylesterase
MHKFLTGLLFTVSPFFLPAEIRLPSVLGSHMVLQQKTDVKIWGWSDPGEIIHIKTTWDTVSYQAVGSGNANWSVSLKTPAAGGPYTITLSGKNTIVLEDVLIGEVWVCSGQSNMEMHAGYGLKQSVDEMPNANNPNIRLFQVRRTTALYPQDDLRGGWVVCNPQDMQRFSAVGYFFGKELQQQLKVPVGLINASWGGTPAEVWTPSDVVRADTILKEAASKQKQSSGWPVLPGYTYNAMIAPLIQFPIAGAIWYQGESNVGTWSGYQELLTSLIGSWRTAWQRNFPFYFVQIAPFAKYGNQNVGALLREAQTRVLSYPNTGMVVTSDLVNNVNDIHPQLKKEVALRLANYALATTYGKTGISYKSPLYKSMKIEKDKIRIYFDNAEQGLISKDGAATEFYIAGGDQQFLPAQARIDGNTVVVWNATLKNPVAVRFGFSNAAMPNLFGKDGLPVNLFRTDDWSVDTSAVTK